MLTTLEESTIKSIINIFETSEVLGDYANITLIPGDTGGLTYGRSQTTLTSGGLHDLVLDYCADPQRPFADKLTPYIQPLKQKNSSLNGDIYLHNLLRAAADYAIMRHIQDVFFDRFYWEPARSKAGSMGVETALGVAVIYDGTVHGSLGAMKTRTDNKVGKLANVGEKRWIKSYVEVRRDWLANHSRADLRPTVYRMDAFKAMIDDGAWNLPLPLIVRGVTISPETLAATPRRVFDGPETGSRDLAVQSTVLHGRDVRHLQVGLSAPEIGERVKADGLYGNGTAGAVKRHQQRLQMPATGVATRDFMKRIGL